MLLPVIAAFSAGGAFACPTVGDLTTTGIVITYEDGTRSQYREVANGVVENDVFEAGSEDGYWSDALYGAYPLQYGLIEKGKIAREGTEILEYDSPPEGVKGPAAESYWTGVATILDGDRSPLVRARISVSAESFETFGIGDYVYDPLPMTVLVDDSINVMLFDYMYLDALGVAALVAESFTGDDFPDRPEYKYAPVSIEGQGFFNR